MAVDSARDLIDACDDPGSTARRLRDAGHRVIRVLGHDAPYSLLRASGLAPVRMVPADGDTPHADALAGDGTLSRRGRSLLEQLVTDDSGDPLLLTHADSELPQLFATIRELIRTGAMARRPVHFLDRLHQPRESTRAYNRRRLAALVDWLPKAGGHAPTAEEIEASAREERSRGVVLAGWTGIERIAAIGAACALLPDEWHGAVSGGCAAGQGETVFVLGSAQHSTHWQQALAQRGLESWGDDQDWGDPLVAAWDASPLTLEMMSDPAWLIPRGLVRAADRLVHVAARIEQAGLRRAVFIVAEADEGAAWDAGYFAEHLTGRGVEVERITEARAVPQAAAAGPRPRAAADGRRSRKSLASIATFGAFQRDWFQSLRGQVADGAPLAVVNANSPQEMLRAMGIPFVVNQWWASIVAAKQQSPRYFELLRGRGYPSDAEAYSAQGLAAFFDHDAAQAPWGGLPCPGFVQAVLSTDATPRIFDHWARETGADLFLFERSIESRLELPVNWWDILPEAWDELIEPERLDLLVAEIEAVIAAIEARSGYRLDHDAFTTIMALVNEQEDYYRQARDMIAAARPVPVSIVDTMPATMVPQWHRGTPWARDAARSFRDEVQARLNAGDVACPGEALRLMWVGRGMWSDMGFYQRWEQSHGAVFVWSMYLALAADGYIRNFDRGRDPLRALAARFVTMGDELRMPTWAGAWHVREAQSHGVDGAVALSDADPFVLQALRHSGVPVLSIDLDNYNQEASDAAAIDRQIADFLEGPVSRYARAQRAG